MPRISARLHGASMKPLLVAGIDEAGRGPLAGSVYAGAVILYDAIDGLQDSKALPPAQRECLFHHIQKQSYWAVGYATVDEIDALNILQATLLAMKRAVDNLPIAPEFVWVDGQYCPLWRYPCSAIVKGDQTIAAISAASIIAKVTRDREMVAMDRLYPGYGFARHKGYATPQHIQALKEKGTCLIHRRSFVVKEISGR